jgi:CBS domain-containing protein
VHELKDERIAADQRIVRAHLTSLVERFMVKDVVSVRSDASLVETQAALDQRGCSAVAIVKDRRAIGVVSRTDLLRSGRREAAGHGGPLAPLAARTAIEIATRPVVTAGPKENLSRVAARMVKARIHRVFVEDDEALRGVFSTLDLLRAIITERVLLPVGGVMSKPAFTIPVTATIAHATDRLRAANVTGVVVIDEEGWPVGIFSQREALASRAMPAETSVEEVMNYALVCLHAKAPLHRAASLASAARARRVLVIEDRRVVGVVSPLDFARAVSASA